MKDKSTMENWIKIANGGVLMIPTYEFLFILPLLKVLGFFLTYPGNSLQNLEFSVRYIISGPNSLLLKIYHATSYVADSPSEEF